MQLSNIVLLFLVDRAVAYPALQEQWLIKRDKGPNFPIPYIGEPLEN